VAINTALALCARRVLFVDDEAEMLRRLPASLEEEGAYVTWARNGRSALEALRGSLYSLLILDLGLPDVSGAKVLEIARAEGIAPRVLILTGTGAYDDPAGEALRLGVDHYLVKPIRPFELVRAAAAVISSPWSRTLDRRSDAGDGIQESSGSRGSIGMTSDAVRPSLDRMTSASRRQSLVFAVAQLAEATVTVPRVVAGAALLRRIGGRPHQTGNSVGPLFENGPNIRSPSHPLIRKIVQDFETGRLRGKVSEKELAVIVGLSRSHLSRLMKQETGLQFAHWDRYSRLKRAFAALAHTSDPIGRIALENGWSSREQFNHHFVAACGMTPSEFRRTYRTL
jgi:DNA-binding response OmpR family regulator/AraC-like DNA-binding protein